MGKHELRGEHGPELELPIVLENLEVSEDGERFIGTVAVSPEEFRRIRGEEPVEGEYPEVGGAGAPFGLAQGGIVAGETGTVRLTGEPGADVISSAKLGGPVGRVGRAAYRNQLMAYQHGLDKTIRTGQPKVEHGEFRCPTCSFSAFLERPDDRGILIYHRGRYFPCRAPEGYVRATTDEGMTLDG